MKFQVQAHLPYRDRTIISRAFEDHKIKMSDLAHVGADVYSCVVEVVADDVQAAKDSIDAKMHLVFDPHCTVQGIDRVVVADPPPGS